MTTATSTTANGGSSKATSVVELLRSVFRLRPPLRLLLRRHRLHRRCCSLETTRSRRLPLRRYQSSRRLRKPQRSITKLRALQVAPPLCTLGCTKRRCSKNNNNSHRRLHRQHRRRRRQSRSRLPPADRASKAHHRIDDDIRLMTSSRLCY